MKITPDTNVLVRAVVNDDEKQSAAAQRLLVSAEVIAIPISTLCEFVWVLRTVYGRARPEIAQSIRDLMSAAPVVCDRATAEAGLAHLLDGGDFADGAIAYEGQHRGGTTFATFDAKAAKRLAKSGYQVTRPE